MMPPHECPKCGGHWVSGPRYIVRHSHGRIVELLEYRCGCGYRWSEPVRDNTRSLRALLEEAGK